MTRALHLVGLELTTLRRRRWLLVTIAGGILGAVATTLVAATHDGAIRDDSFRASSASVFLVGGLILALGLGGTTIARGGATGHLGVLVAAGASRTTVTMTRLGARAIALAGGLGVWLIALQIGSIALGRGVDGPLAVHAAASLETFAVVLAAAAATSTVLGPIIAGIVGFFTYVTMQAVVNLNAATDVGLLGAWERPAQIGHAVLPRAVLSPMIVDLQNRGEGGPAAPRFEVLLDDAVDLGVRATKVPVPLPEAGLGTVLLTLAWCGVLAYLCVLGMRRRTL